MSGAIRTALKLGMLMREPSMLASSCWVLSSLPDSDLKMVIPTV